MSEWASASRQGLNPVSRFLDWLAHFRSIGIETWPITVGHGGMLGHDLGIRVFNRSDRQIDVSEAWLDLRSARRGTHKGMVLPWRDLKKPTVIDAETNDTGIAAVQLIIDGLGSPRAKWWYRVGIQLKSGRTRHSRWRRFPPATEGYSGGKP